MFVLRGNCSLTNTKKTTNGSITKTFKVEPRALHKSRDLVVACLQYPDEDLAELESLTKESGTYLDANCSNVKMNDVRIALEKYLQLLIGNSA